VSAVLATQESQNPQASIQHKIGGFHFLAGCCRFTFRLQPAASAIALSTSGTFSGAISGGAGW